MSDTPASSSHATKAMEAAEEVCSLMFAAKGNVTSREMIAMVADNLRKHMPPSVPVSALEELAATWEAWSPRNPTEFEAGIEQGRYADAVELRRAIKATREPKPRR